MNFFDNFNKKHLISAHRGYKALYPENSMKAFKNSYKQCDFIEFDVQFTKDYIPVITHDKTIQSATNVEELEEFHHIKPYYVKDFLFKDLLKLNFHGEKIASLDEFLNFAKKRKLYFNLEIKELHSKAIEKKAIKIILKKIKKYKCEKQVLISSFNHEYLKKVKNLNAKINIAVLDEDIKREHLIKYLRNLDATSYHINEELVDKHLVKKLQKKGIKTCVYTINNIQKIKKLFRQNVSAVFCDLHTLYSNYQKNH